MTIDNIQAVVEEFIKRLQLPDAKYSFSVASSNEFVELIIFIDNAVACSIGISNGSIRMLYNDDYTSDKYLVLNFLTPITLVYQLCILFYAAVKDLVNMDFNNLLETVLFNEVHDWKTLTCALCENIGMNYMVEENYVEVEGNKIQYTPYLNKIYLDMNEIDLEDDKYTTLVEAIFKSVEYIANIFDVADNLFQLEDEIDNVEEGEMEEAPQSAGGDVNVDMDVDMGEDGGEEVAPVEPMENEDFSEPQGPVVELDDLIE